MTGALPSKLSMVGRVILIALSLFISGEAAGFTQPNPWRALAESDARAALELVEKNHPGAVPELGDKDFLNRLQTARTNVETRLANVDSYSSYDALMSGLAADFGDGHIWSTPLVSYPYRAWAGIILRRRAQAWEVQAQEREGDEPELLGYRLISCDDMNADLWGRQRIGLFRGNSAIEAQLARHAAWLLLRDGNPFLERPKTCTFVSSNGDSRTISLKWRQVELPYIEQLIARGNARVDAGLGVETFSRGYWIKLGTLEREAAKVVTEVESRQDVLRTTPVIVLDLRGNGGGDSSYAVAIGRALVGSARLSAVTPKPAKCSGSFWRTSSGNLETLKAWRDRLSGGDEQSFAYVSGLVQDMKSAIIDGSPFAPKLSSCASENSGKAQLNDRPDRVPAALMRGKLVLVSDRSCFSSCLIAVDLFRRLGALHVGETTDVSTRYMEVRQEVLPSGIRTFSTLQKVALGMSDFGPYQPDLTYPGDLADTEALQRWVTNIPDVSSSSKIDALRKQLRTGTD